MQKVFSLVFIVIGDNDTTSSERLFRFGVAKLRKGQRSRDRHDARRHQDLSLESKTNIANKDGAGNGSKTTSHDLMDFGLGHMRNKRSHQHGRLALANKGSGGSDNSFGSRNTQSPEDKGRKLLNKPLNKANVVEHLNQGNEEDDGGNDGKQEPLYLANAVGGQEDETIGGKAKQIAGAVSNELEDGEAGAGSQDKKSDDVLGKYTCNDGAPIYFAAVSAAAPEGKEDEKEAKHADGAAIASVVLIFLGNKGANKHDSDGDNSAGNGAEPWRDGIIDDERRVLPRKLDCLGKRTRGDVPGNDA